MKPWLLLFGLIGCTPLHPPAVQDLRVTVDARWFEKDAPFGTLALDTGQVSEIVCEVTGLGMAGARSVRVPAVEGRASFELDDVPIGAHRVVTVKGLDINGQFIPGHELKSLVNIRPDQTATVQFSHVDTAMARVVEALLGSGETFWATQLNGADLRRLIESLSRTDGDTPGIHPSLLDAGAIAKAIVAQQGVPVAATPAMRIPQAGRLRGVVTGFAPGTAVTVTCLDPASRPLTLRVPQGGRLVFSLEGITPGRWSVSAKPAATAIGSTGFLSPLLLNDETGVGALTLAATGPGDEQILVVVNPSLGPRPAPGFINASAQLTPAPTPITQDVTVELNAEVDVTLIPQRLTTASLPFRIQALPEIGSQKSFWVVDPQGKEVKRTAILRHISAHALVYVDQQQDGLLPPDAGQISTLLRHVEEVIYPTLLAKLGKPRDIDSNNRIQLLFTPVVNFHVGLEGYFRGPDLLSDTEALFYFKQHSNEGELLTLRFPKASELQYAFHLAGTIAHELAHLINWSHHFPVVGIHQETWLDEGLAVLAADLTGFGFSAGQPVDVERVRKALEAPESWSLVNWQAGTDPAGYGVSYLFTRYLYDRFGDFWLEQVFNPKGAVAGMNAVLEAIDRVGQPMPDAASLLRDWAIALAMTDSAKISDPRFRLKIRLKDSARALAGVKLESLSPSQALQMGVMPAGIRYFRLDGIDTGGMAIQLAGRNGTPLKAAVVRRPL